jgi:hypothetical protein
MTFPGHGPGGSDWRLRTEEEIGSTWLRCRIQREAAVKLERLEA